MQIKNTMRHYWLMYQIVHSKMFLKTVSLGLLSRTLTTKYVFWTWNVTIMVWPSQGHCDFPSFPVVDWFCLFVDLCVLPFPFENCSVFGNFVITLIRHGQSLSVRRRLCHSTQCLILYHFVLCTWCCFTNVQEGVSAHLFCIFIQKDEWV
jgi:hypothetical protein